MGKKITIQGKVHNVGYRLLLLDQADNLFIPYFDARNVKLNGKETLVVLVDGEDEQLKDFTEFVHSNFPEKAVIENIAVEEYTGKIKEIDKYRKSFDTLQLSKIVQSGLVLLEYTKYIPEMRDDIKEIKVSSYRTNQLLEEKFTKLDNEITNIKMALVKAGIEVR